MEIGFIMVFVILCVSISLMVFCIFDEDMHSFRSYCGIPVVMCLFLLLYYPINLKTERIYLKDIPNQSQLYEYKSTSDTSKEFMYYDGNVQQVLSGDLNLKIYYRDDLKESYAEVKYFISLLGERGDLQEQNIESIDVYLLKEEGK